MTCPTYSVDGTIVSRLIDLKLYWQLSNSGKTFKVYLKQESKDNGILESDFVDDDECLCHIDLSKYGMFTQLME